MHPSSLLSNLAHIYIDTSTKLLPCMLLTCTLFEKNMVNKNRHFPWFSLLLQDYIFSLVPIVPGYGELRHRNHIRIAHVLVTLAAWTWKIDTLCNTYGALGHQGRHSQCRHPSACSCSHVYLGGRAQVEPICGIRVICHAHGISHTCTQTRSNAS